MGRGGGPQIGGAPSAERPRGTQLPAGRYHKVHTVSARPSCFMYTYVNTTAVALERDLNRLQELRDRLRNGTGGWEAGGGERAGGGGGGRGPGGNADGSERGFAPPTETEPLPPELRPIIGEPPPPGAELDPLVAAFLRRQRRMEEAGQRRNASAAQRLQRFLARKLQLFRRRSEP